MRGANDMGRFFDVAVLPAVLQPFQKGIDSASEMTQLRSCFPTLWSGPIQDANENTLGASRENGGLGVGCGTVFPDCLGLH